MSKYDLVLLFPLIFFAIAAFISLFWESKEEIDDRERREKHWIEARREQKEIDRNCL